MGCIVPQAEKAEHKNHLDVHTQVTSSLSYHLQKHYPRISYYQCHPGLRPIMEARSSLEFSASYEKKQEYSIQ